MTDVTRAAEALQSRYLRSRVACRLLQLSDGMDVAFQKVTVFVRTGWIDARSDASHIPTPGMGREYQRDGRALTTLTAPEDKLDA